MKGKHNVTSYLVLKTTLKTAAFFFVTYSKNKASHNNCATFWHPSQKCQIHDNEMGKKKIHKNYYKFETAVL